MTRGWLVGWSAFVAVSWLVLAASLADDETCSFICFSFADMLYILVFPAAVVWSLGMIVVYVVLRRRSRRQVARSGPPA